jgi:hypothetical protein
VTPGPPRCAAPLEAGGTPALCDASAVYAVGELGVPFCASHALFLREMAGACLRGLRARSREVTSTAEGGHRGTPNRSRSHRSHGGRTVPPPAVKLCSPAATSTHLMPGA